MKRADIDMFMSKIIEIQDKISNENKVAYYNINLLNFVTHKKTNDFIDNVISQEFIPYITKPTRITANSATLTDHIYSNHSHPNHESGILITDTADHFAIFHIIYGNLAIPLMKHGLYYVKQCKTKRSI